MNLSCYEYLKRCYAVTGDYAAAVSFGHKVRLSTIISDVDALAAYIQSLGLKCGDVFTVFLPTTVHGFTAFYALNKIGVTANIVHPLTSPTALKESVVATGTKAIMILDILTADYVGVLNELNLPCIVCSNSDYVSAPKRPAFRVYETVKSKSVFELRCRFTTYKAAIIKGRFMKCESIKGGRENAVYLHGGGTTGTSKTIMLSSNAINAVAEKLVALDCEHKPGDEYSLIVLPMFHAFGLVTAMHFSITHGFTSITVPKFSAEDANKLCKKYNVTFIVGVPNMFKKMFEQENFAGDHLKRFRLLFCGGDFLSEQFVKQFNDKIKQYGGTGRLYRGYGLTEVCSVCSVNTLKESRAESIGKPLGDIRIEIWNEMRKPVAARTVGEIVVSGDTLMEGYFNGDPRLKNDGVYTDASGTRWVLTGDLGFIDEDGYIFFTGRKKRMIVISGYNVYPMDIETAVANLPFVNEACAVQGYQKGKPCVKLCVSLNCDMKQDDAISKISSYCKKNLSRFSCPRKIEIFDSLPKTQMAKIDFMKLSDRFPTSLG